MQRTRRVEILQSHRTRPDMCPKVELYSRVEVLVSIDYSSSEMKIASNPRHAIASAYEA